LRHQIDTETISSSEMDNKKDQEYIRKKS